MKKYLLLAIATMTLNQMVCAKDVLDEYEYVRHASAVAAATPVAPPELDESEKKIWDVLSFDAPMSIDEIIMKLDMDMGDMPNLTTTLLTMTMSGAIRSDSVGGYLRAPD